jgi:hypothetical protein
MISSTAQFSAEEPEPLYRYNLVRIWDDTRPVLLWGLLNPSTAGPTVNDPTVRKCVGFSKLWQYGGMILFNLFGYRSTAPERLLEVDDPVGPENDKYIRRALDDVRVHRVIVGWGTGNAASKLVAARASQVLEIIRATPHADALACVGINLGGTPRHPLYVANATEPIPYQPAHWAYVGTGEHTMSLQIELLHSPSTVIVGSSPGRHLTPPDEPQWGPRATDHPRA